MTTRNFPKWLVAVSIFAGVAGISGLTHAQSKAAEAKAAQPAAQPAEERPDAATCLACHGNKGFEATGPDGKPRQLHVNSDKFGKSVHGKQLCVDCHKDITEIPHKEGVSHKVSCVQCHEALWDKAQKDNTTKEHARLGVVVEQINKYMKSIHARPSREDQSRTNATCYACHDAHYVFPKGSPERTEWRLSVPNACGKCHTKNYESWRAHPSAPSRRRTAARAPRRRCREARRSRGGG